jgi:cytochrome P450
MRRVPLSRGHWLLGHALDLRAAPHRFAADVALRNGGMAEIRFLHRRLLVVSDGDVARHILVTRAERYRRSFHYENPVLGNGLLSTDGPGWLKRRRQVGAAFRRETLERLVPVVVAETERLIERWSERMRAGEAIPLKAEMHRLAIRVIGRSLLSESVDEAKADELGALTTRTLRLVARRNTTLPRLPTWVPTSVNRGLLASRASLEDFLRPIIASRRDAPPRGDLLDRLLAVRDPETGDALSDAEVLDEAKTLFGAGYETTASALTWTLDLLARHPEAADRLRAEATAQLGTGVPTFADLARLPFLSSVINESLRIFPPVYNLGRVNVESDEIDGHPVPRGRVAVISILGMHHDPRVWGDPEVFRPERFDGEWPSRWFMPFATGQHVCIGNNFALTEMAVCLAMIVRNFEIRPADATPTEAIGAITLVPAREISVRLSPAA